MSDVDQTPERRRVDRERVLRTLTFWLRPEFLLRVVNRFQKVAGFDRSIALASGALTAMIPLAVVTSALGAQLGGKSTAERIIDRYELTGGGAEAVTDIFSPPSGTSTTIGIVGVLFLLVTLLSFSRAVQRLFEQTWELDPLSVRNTFNGLLWIGGLSLYVTLSGVLHAVLGRGRLELGATLVGLPLSAVFLLWSGWVLSAKRIARHELVGGGRPRDPRRARPIGRGERPAEDEVRRQWDEVTTQARSRWETLRLQLQARRRKRDAD